MTEQVKRTITLISWSNHNNQLSSLKKIATIPIIERLIRNLNLLGFNDIYIENGETIKDHIGNKFKEVNFVEEFEANSSKYDELLFVPGNAVFTINFLGGFINEFRNKDRSSFVFCFGSKANLIDSVFITKDKECMESTINSLNSKEELTFDSPQFFTPSKKYGAKLYLNKSDAWPCRRILMRALAKDNENPVARHLNRKIAQWISIFLTYLRFSPNFITTFVVIITLFASYLLLDQSRMNLIISGIIFYFAQILDECDGEVARLTYKMSNFGAWYDSITDRIRFGVFFFAIGYGLYLKTMLDVYLYCSIILGLMYIYSSWVGSKFTWDNGGTNISLANMISKLDIQEKRSFSQKIITKLSWLGTTDVLSFLSMIFLLLYGVKIFFFIIFVGTIFLAINTYQTSKKFKK